MTRVGGRKLELICVLCNESLADLERACAGELGNIKNENNVGAARGGMEPSTDMSETNFTQPPDSTVVGTGATGGSTVNPQPHYGGYMPLSEHNTKQVVATKCGHMFHQGCLRKHVHKTLIEGKGGSLFCPICTRPFAMNRLWPVIIPPTKTQRERYIQIRLMKDQNIEMVKQLKEVRAKIAEEEAHLEKVKENSEQCLQDIQQKQKLLDSVNGPTNKEMAELTKLHMKRQEILHVVTQHNADLLKLLAEESNISTATAENMINTSGHIPSSDFNQNYAPASATSLRVETATRKGSRRIKKEKIRKKDKSTKKSRKHHHGQYDSPPSSKSRTTRRGVGGGAGVDSEAFMDAAGDTLGGSHLSGPNPSELITEEDSIRQMNRRTKSKSTCRKVDTLSKWKMESMKELMCLPGFSETNANHLSTASIHGHPDDFNATTTTQHHHRQRNHHGTSNNNNNNKKESVNIMLSRKTNMLDKDGFGGGAKK